MKQIGFWSRDRLPGVAESVATGHFLAASPPGGRELLTAAQGEELLRWNLDRGAPAAVGPLWRTILAGRGRVVVTGQQPALLGGPLYTLYKLLTAEALSRRIERESGQPCLAVFWIVGDDSDFGEVSGAWLPDSDFSLARLRDPQAPETGTQVGGLEAERQRDLLPVPADPGANDPPARARAWLDAAAPAGESWSGLLARLIYARIPDLRAVFVDGAHASIVAAQSAWLRRVVGEPLSGWLEEGAREVRANGIDPVLDPELGERAVYRVRGARREPGSGPIGAAEDLAPNVVLRPLVQDLLLPNAATVCGAAEIRYRAQLHPVYRRLGVPAPPLFARLGAVIIPPINEPGLRAALAEDEWLSLRDPDAWLARRAQAAVPGALLDTAAGVRRRALDDLERIGGELAGYDEGLVQQLDSVRGKVDYQLRRLEEGILGRARHQLLRREPALARWREFVRPRDGEQERALTLLTPYLYEPGSATEPLRAAARHFAEADRADPRGVAVFELEPDGPAPSRGTGEVHG